jgi:hypothetical protein
VLYDERWQDKQERGFTRCINHILSDPNAPSEEAPSAAGGSVGARHASSAYRDLSLRRSDVITR